MPKYFVLNDHTLVYKSGYSAGPLQEYGVLGVSALKPGSLIGRFSVMVAPTDKLVPATFSDFDFYRCSPRGHLSPEGGALDAPLADVDLLRMHADKCQALGVPADMPAGAKLFRQDVDAYVRDYLKLDPATSGKTEISRLVNEYVIAYLGIDLTE